MLIKLISSAGTGFFYTAKKARKPGDAFPDCSTRTSLVSRARTAFERPICSPLVKQSAHALPSRLRLQNPRNFTQKLAFRKYDPIVRQHVVFNESKMK